MELAVYYCRGRELKDAVIVAYLLEYYSRNPTNCVGWLCTVSKAIPLLFKYNYDDYARRLFIRCFVDQSHFSGQDPDEIIPKKFLESYNNTTKFRAFTPTVKLISDKSDKYKWYNNWFWDKCKSFKSNILGIYFVRKILEILFGNFEKSPLALRVVPFPCFTINSIPEGEIEFTPRKFILNSFLFLFIPRWYRIDHDDIVLLSPFSRMIHYENNDDIYDNPATEAVINFCWRTTKYFLYFLCLRFLIFATCFILVSWAYLNRGNIINGYFTFILIFIFYYLALYQISTEISQFRYRGFKKYFSELLTFFDISSIILSVLVMTKIVKNFQFSDCFGSVKETDSSLVVEISFSIFLIWIKFILFLRLRSDIGIYIYYVVIIFQTIIPFFWFMLVVIFAFAHTMFILLRDPKYMKIKESSYSGNATNTLTNEILNITLKSDFEPTSSDDNPFSTFYTAIQAAYFWISGDWVQRNEFDYWAVDLFTLIASIFLVIILQNILIAFMNGVYVTAGTKGKQRLLRYRANHIVDYEALHHIHFSKPEPEPKHIYYFSQAKNFEEWYNTRKSEQGAIYKDSEEPCISTISTVNNIFRKKDYDEHSILKYNDNTLTIVEDFISLGNEVSDNIENLIEKFIGKHSIEEIEEIENKNIDLEAKIDKLYHKLEKLKKQYLYKIL
ncbi:unnamed protein product [Rhizophagus irregularis]|nr:unnamed protein product [Rhizophagus irregularis]